MIYRYKASIANNKIFMREYEIKDSTNLFSLNQYLINDLGFSPDQMSLFRAIDSKGKVKGEYGLFDLGDGTMDSIKLKDLVSKGYLILEYVYDMFKDRFIILTLVSQDEELHNTRRVYPRLVAERGKNPDQFSDNYDDFENMIEFGDTDPLSIEGDVTKEL